jgi:5-methylcytosine-specific restriction endonuclease McrA
MKAIDFNCTRCNKRVKKPRRPTSTHLFCSKPCEVSWRRENPASRSFVCDNCGKRFHHRHRRPNAGRYFCSRECWRRSQAREKIERLKDQEHQKKLRDRRLAREKRRYRENPEAAQARHAQWRQDNPDRHRAIMREAARRHRREHPDRYAARRAGISRAEWNAIKAKYNHRCLCCGATEPDIRLEPDHVIPISRGGRNIVANIQPLCRSCNARKNAKTTDYR